MLLVWLLYVGFGSFVVIIWFDTSNPWTWLLLFFYLVIVLLHTFNARISFLPGVILLEGSFKMITKFKYLEFDYQSLSNIKVDEAKVLSFTYLGKNYKIDFTNFSKGEELEDNLLANIGRTDS